MTTGTATIGAAGRDDRRDDLHPGVRRRPWRSPTTGPSFADRRARDYAPDAAVPLEWSETENVTWKTPVEGRGWSSPVVADGRVWLTTALTDSDEGSSLRLLAYDVETGANTLDVEVFGSDETYLLNREEQHIASPTPVLDPDGERVYVHLRGDRARPRSARAATSSGARWFPYISQHGNGGSPILHDGRLVVSIDRLRHGLPRGGRRAHGGGKLALDPPGPGVAGLFDADRHSCRGPGADRQRQRVPDDGTRPADRRRDLERRLSERLLERPAPGLRPRARLPVDRLPDAGAAGRPRRRGGRRHAVAYRLAVSADGAPLTPSPILVGNELYIVTDFGIGTCDRRTDRRHPLAGTARRQPLRLAGVRRRAHLLPERGGASRSSSHPERNTASWPGTGSMDRRSPR